MPQIVIKQIILTYFQSAHHTTKFSCISRHKFKRVEVAVFALSVKVVLAIQLGTEMGVHAIDIFDK